MNLRDLVARADSCSTIPVRSSICCSGPNSGILGFAGPEWVDEVTCDVLEGVSFLNGPSFDDAQVALDVMVHEFGHYQGLGHSIVNGQIVIGDSTGPSPFNTFPVTSLVNLIETMYPFYFGPAAGFSTPHKDDIAALATLYPAPTFFATTGTITGRVLASNGRTPKPGFNVIARNIANPFADAVSGISGAFTTDLSPDSPLAGTYVLNGLTPGARYAIFVDEILEGEFSVDPGILPGPEEFYSGRDESKRRGKDRPDEFAPVRARAGAEIDGIDIIFNGFIAGELLPLRDESSIELSLPFTFSMCGTRYHEVFVNSNGTLTFGAPLVDFSESVPEFLAGRPQIAGLWDDLDPSGGGEIFFTEDTRRHHGSFQRRARVRRQRRTDWGQHLLHHAQTIPRSDHVEIWRSDDDRRSGGRELWRCHYQRLRDAGRSQ